MPVSASFSLKQNSRFLTRFYPVGGGKTVLADCEFAGETIAGYTAISTGALMQKKEFVDIVAESWRDGTFRMLVLSRQRKSAESSIRKVTFRQVALNDQVKVQATIRDGNKEVHENFSVPAAVIRLNELYGGFLLDAHLFTETVDLTGRLKGGAVRVKRSRPSRADEPAVQVHNREKAYLIPDGQPCAFLEEIGVMTAEGEVKPSRYSKFRQINRYLEFVNDILSQLPAGGPLSVVDFGCGKSYLTFALHHFLTNICGREVQMTGIDQKADVVADCQAIAAKLGLQNLSFQKGDIRDFHPDGAVHLAVSLHACDTATDVALAKAVDWQSNVILAVPCCQHELSNAISSEPLSAILRHGLMRERIASLATDALRAQLLDIVGYRTQVVEFIDMEHTAKNILLRAVRSTAASVAETWVGYESLKKSFGIETFELERLLRERIPVKA